MNYDYNWRPHWYDNPIGRYTITAQIRHPASTAAAKPARLAAVALDQASKAPIPRPASTATIEFTPDTSQTYAGGTHPVMLYVMD